MGILTSNAELMIEAKSKGVIFEKVLTLGRLKLYVSKNEIKKLIEKYKLDVNRKEIQDFEYSDDFFRIVLGAKEVKSLDYSDYESCNMVHDMNIKIDLKHHETFDVVVDGGTLEHVFNFPNAISNCMNLLKEKGSFFSFTMANNHMGHGFYQFSPELFYRIFNSANGFKVKNLFLEEHKYPGSELNQNSNIYKVRDPVLINDRVGLVSCSPVLMLVHAIREEVKQIFAKPPIQSDYLETYKSQNKNTKSFNSKFKNYLIKIYSILPKNMQSFVVGRMQLRRNSFKNRSFYIKK